MPLAVGRLSAAALLCGGSGGAGSEWGGGASISSSGDAAVCAPALAIEPSPWAEHDFLWCAASHRRSSRAVVLAHMAERTSFLDPHTPISHAGKLTKGEDGVYRHGMTKVPICCNKDGDQGNFNICQEDCQVDWRWKRARGPSVRAKARKRKKWPPPPRPPTIISHDGLPMPPTNMLTYWRKLDRAAWDDYWAADLDVPKHCLSRLRYGE